MAGATGDAGIVALTDELIVALHEVMLNPAAITGGDVALLEQCPNVRDVSSAADVFMTVDPWERVREVRDCLIERGQEALVTQYLPPGVADLTDREMTVALSGMQPEYDSCATAPGAVRYGDDDGCDAAKDACDARVLPACNDLYWASAVGSEYEEVGASRGRRATFGDMAYGGFCEELP